MNHQLICGDALTELRRLRAGAADLLISSPPYNVGKAYERRVAMEAYADWIRPICAESIRALRPGASFCWQVGMHIIKGKEPRGSEVLPLDFIFIPMLQELGLTYRDRFIWTFGHGLHCKYRFSGRHETILWFTKGEVDFDVEEVRARLLGEDGSGVWRITNIKNNHREKTAHPCQFPELLVERLLTNLSGRGDTVLEPFADAGTVSAVAERCGRKSISIELNPEYVAIARERVRAVWQLLRAA